MFFDNWFTEVGVLSFWFPLLLAPPEALLARLSTSPPFPALELILKFFPLAELMTLSWLRLAPSFLAWIIGMELTPLPCDPVSALLIIVLDYSVKVEN